MFCVQKKIPPQLRSGISYTKLHRFQTKSIYVQIYYSTERRNMEQVFASDYEDVYRVKDGVMFYVKKYRRVYDENGCSKQIYFEDKPKLKCYARKGDHRYCTLRIANEDGRVNDGFALNLKYETVNKGSVFEYSTGGYPRNGYLVELAENESSYKYEIKTQGNMFVGDASDLVEFLNEIIDQIGVYDWMV